MSDTVLRVFRSDFQVLAHLLIKLASYGALFLLAATIIGQLRGHRFPSYFDLVAAPLIAPAACAVLGLLFYIMVIAFPVKVFAHGLRAYNYFGRYSTVEWEQIDAMRFTHLNGLPYLLIFVPKYTQEIWLPLWLENMPEFIQLIEQQAGAHHPLVRALREAT